MTIGCPADHRLSPLKIGCPADHRLALMTNGYAR